MKIYLTASSAVLLSPVIMIYCNIIFRIFVYIPTVHVKSYEEYKHSSNQGLVDY